MTVDGFKALFGVDPSTLDTSPEANARRKAEREARERKAVEEFFATRTQGILDRQMPPENRHDSFGRFDTEGDPVRKQVLEACKAFARDPKGGVLVLVGGCGRGKTLLATSIARVWLEARVRDLGNPVDLVYTTEQSMLERYAKARAFRTQESTEDVVRYFSSGGLLVVDELGKWRDTGDGLAVLEGILDHRIGLNPTVLLSNLTPEDFRKRYTGGFLSRVRGSCYALTGGDHRLGFQGNARNYGGLE